MKLPPVRLLCTLVPLIVCASCVNVSVRTAPDVYRADTGEVVRSCLVVPNQSAAATPIVERRSKNYANLVAQQLRARGIEAEFFDAGVGKTTALAKANDHSMSRGRSHVLMLSVDDVPGSGNLYTGITSEWYRAGEDQPVATYSSRIRHMGIDKSEQGKREADGIIAGMLNTDGVLRKEPYGEE